MSSSFAILCRGCKPLEWDAAGVRHALVERGLLETECQTADVIVVMGCTFTQKHEDDFRREIAAVAGGGGAERHVIVSGCYLAAEERDGVHYTRKEDILGHVDSILEGKQLAPRRRKTKVEPLPFVAISEGCYGKCTFCSIQFVRGEHRSRPEAEVVADVRAAFKAHGCVKLVGQDIAAYGRDTGSSLPGLLRAIFQTVPDARLELGTLGTAWMKGMLMSDLAVFADPRIRGNIHLPLQSASDSVLTRMRRGYMVAQFTRLMERLRSVGVVRFSTDLIAGFPGETIEDHRRNVAFLKAQPLAHAQIFAYDPRPGTPAATMRQVPRPTRIRRTIELVGVFLSNCDGFRENEKAEVSDFLNTNIEINLEEVMCHEG